MPIYEYRCTSCRHTFEVIQKLSDAPVATCAHCSGPLEKLFSRTSFHLKGGGWFNNDYGASQTQSLAGKETKDRNDAKGKDSKAKDSEGADSKGKDSKAKDSEGADSKGKDSKASDTGSGSSGGACGSGACGCSG